MYAGRFSCAAKHFDKAGKFADQTGDLFAKGRILINISRNLRRWGRLGKALDAGIRAHSFAEGMRSNVLAALSNRNLARIYAANGDDGLARRHSELWKDFKAETGYPQIGIVGVQSSTVDQTAPARARH
jgi:hypothetical protein